MRPSVLVVTLALALPFAASCANEPTVPNTSGSPSTTPSGLWTVSGSTSAILELDPTQLSDTTPRDASTVITTSSARLNTLAAVAFDTAGNLWVTGLDEPVLVAFEREALESSGSKLARTTIVPSAGSLKSPTGLAFDSQQRLWVADFTGTLNRFDVEQLEIGGAQLPAVVLHVPGNPAAIAFDAWGSLWVSDNVLQVIRKYTAAQLATSGSPLPDVVLSATGLSLVNPAGLAFDAHGNLWVANIGGRTLASFSPVQLGRSGSPSPDVFITPNGGSLSVPVALAFDAEGNLWVIGGTGALTRFSRASLGASGAVVPSLRAQIAARSLFWSIAFWPTPKGLPLGQRSK
jgi:sugar lactone lactonase YvrE